MDEKEFNKLVEKVGLETAKLISAKTDEMRAGLITAEQLATEVESFAKANDIEEINQKMDAMVIDLKKMIQKEQDNEPVTLRDQIKKKHEDLKSAVGDGKAKFIMDLDLKTNVTSASITSDSQGAYIPGFGQAAFRGLAFEQYFQRFPLPPNHHGTVYYVDQTTTTRNAATKNEAAAAPESAIAWTQYSLAMEKILDSIPLTHEAMLDIDQLVAEVEMFINNNIRLAIDTQMWSGNNAAPNWAGIYATYATDFTQAIATGATVDAVADANIYDLIATVATYIANGKESKYDANVAFMNPRDILKGRMVKDANGNYVIPPFVSRDGMQVAGTIVVPSAAVTANTLAIGDARHVRYYDVEGISLEYGLDSDDFTKDLITLKGRKRGNLLLRTVDATAFYKVTDIDQRITDITA